MERVDLLKTFLTERQVPDHVAEAFADAHVRERGLTDPDYRIQAARDLVPYLRSLGGNINGRPGNNEKALASLDEYVAAGMKRSEEADLANAFDSPTPPPLPSSTATEPGNPTDTTSRTPAAVRDLLDSPDWHAAREQALLSLGDNESTAAEVTHRRKAAVHALATLDREISKYAPLFPGGVRVARADVHPVDVHGVESSGGLWVDPSDGRPTLVVDLNTFVVHYAADHMKGAAIEAVVTEELIHRVTLMKFPAQELEASYDRMVADKAGREILTISQKAYYSAHLKTARDQRDLPQNPSIDEKAIIMHEFIRQLVQDSAFRKQVTESTELSPSLRKDIMRWLTKFLENIRSLIKRAPAGLKSEIQAYESKTVAALKELMQPLNRPPPLPPPLPLPTLDDAAHQAATSPQNDLPEPTLPQKEAGNYQKGHVNLGGLDMSIENPSGSTRSGVDAKGNPWSVTMRAHYGYVRGTEGRDGDHVDVFIKPGTPLDYSGLVFVIDQVNPADGSFDEHKVVIGAKTSQQARAIYLSNYAKGWKGLGAMKPMPWEKFKQWVTDGTKTRRATRVVSTETAPAPTQGAAALAADGTAARSFRVSQPISTAFASLPVVDALKGRLMSRSAAQKQKSAYNEGSVYESTPELWDGQPTLAHPTHNQIYGGTLRPDQAAQELFEAGLIGEASPDALWNEIATASQTAKQMAAASRSQREDLKTIEKQGKAFTRDVMKEQEGDIAIPVDELTTGSVVEVDGHKITVASIETDEDGAVQSVVLQDGTKYGRQQVEGGSVLYVENHTPGPLAPGAPPRFNPKQALQVYKRLTSAKKNGITLAMAQQEMMAEAERILGQSFLFEDQAFTPPPAENLVLEQETEASRKPRPEQLTLLAPRRATESSTESPTPSTSQPSTNNQAPATVPPSTKGRAQPGDALIRLADGSSKRMDRLGPEDVVVAPDGTPQHLTGIYPQGLLPVYDVTMAGGVSAQFSEDHLFLARLDDPQSDAFHLRLRDIIQFRAHGRTIYLPTMP